MGNFLLSHTLGACSTIGAEGLNYRVRDGNGWVPLAKVTQNLLTVAPAILSPVDYLNIDGRKVAPTFVCAVEFYGQAEWAISNGKLNRSPGLHIRPIKLVVFQCPS